MTAEQTTTVPLELLTTLLERWEEVADSYKPSGSAHADLEERYSNYRYVQLRAIRNLRQVLDTGTMPCELATEEEQRRGDCGQVHAPEPADTAEDPFAAAEKAFAREPWGPGVTRDQAMANVVTLHLAEALLDGKSEEVRTWARGLAHELKRERIDLIDDIGRHMQRMALGGPTNEIPF
ncbi:hypothetical protein ACFYRI_14610 [Streptomyces microflavus]|uniref:hypothetical protein n=1 Tax=Streptomyces microflavus TaxID=1919 RepID=UPI0036A98CAF